MLNIITVRSRFISTSMPIYERDIGICGVAVSAYFLSGIAVKKIVGCGVAVNLNPKCAKFYFRGCGIAGKKI